MTLSPTSLWSCLWFPNILFGSERYIFDIVWGIAQSTNKLISVFYTLLTIFSPLRVKTIVLLIVQEWGIETLNLEGEGHTTIYISLQARRLVS